MNGQSQGSLSHLYCFFFHFVAFFMHGCCVSKASVDSHLLIIGYVAIFECSFLLYIFLKLPFK